MSLNVLDVKSGVDINLGSNEGFNRYRVRLTAG